jgi:ankyrin repeat protein
MDLLVRCADWLPCLTPAPSVGVVHEISVRDKRKGRDLYDACWDGDVMGCIDLLDKGASPNIPFGLKNATALHAAVKTDSLNIVRAIMKFDPDLTLMDTDGYTALDLALKNGKQHLADEIRRAS